MTVRRPVTLNVNGRVHEIFVEPRRLLSDALRHDIGLTGTNVGCEQGVCGACTILVDGRPERSCLTFAVQAEGVTITTVEGLAPGPGELSPLQQAFRDCHALQCGFCTPGFLMAATDVVARLADLDESSVREALIGNICRCTGYETIVQAVARSLRSEQTET